MEQTRKNFLIRKATIEDISRIAEILVFVKRMNYRAIFRNDAVSFGEIQVLPVAAELIEFAIKEHDVKFLWVLEKNSNAIRFYEAHGFHITGNRMLEEGTPEYKVMLER